MFLLIEFAIWAILCTVFVSYEKGVAAFVATIGAGVVACFAMSFNPFVWLWANPLVAVQLGIIYMGVGLGWACLKWYIKLRKASGRYSRDKAEYLAVGDRSEEQWIDSIKRGYGKEEYAPTVSRNKGNLGFWCIWWPFSMVTFLLEDFIKEMWNFTWKLIKNIFESMRKRTLGEAAEDLD